MKIKKISLLLVSSLFILGACKPTEKGYQAAYNAAVNKRQVATPDYDETIAVGKLQQIDGPQLKEINGKSVYLLSENLKALNPEQSVLLPYNVAVAKFKMPTNTLALSKDLNSDGYPAFAVQNGEEIYYVIASTFETLEEAVEFYDKYQKENKRAYVGLPDYPVIIYSPV